MIDPTDAEDIERFERFRRDHDETFLRFGPFSERVKFLDAMWVMLRETRAAECERCAKIAETFATEIRDLGRLVGREDKATVTVAAFEECAKQIRSPEP